jgi:hypothetical protein
VLQAVCAEGHVRFESIHKPRRAAWVMLLTGLFAWPRPATADATGRGDGAQQVTATGGNDWMAG